MERATSRIIRRQRILLVITTLAALVAAVALGVGMTVRSSAQRAADQAPHPPSVVTGTVTKDKVVRSLIVRARIEAQSVDVKALASQAAEQLVVTGLPLAAGDRVANGSVVAQVSGRLVIVWQSPIPFYRDLRPGATGPDVDALRAAMAKAGLIPSARPGQPFGPATQQALAAHYRAHGYDPITTDDLDPSAPAARRAASDVVRQAKRAVADASDEQARARAQEDLKAAQRDLADLEPGVVVPVGELAAVPTLPARISAVAASVGQDMAAGAERTILSIATGSPQVRAAAPLSEKSALKAGQLAVVTDEVTGDSHPCKVSSLTRAVAAKTTGENATQEGELQLLLQPDKPLPASVVGDDARAAITLQSSQTAVLNVPIAAVVTGIDGSGHVTRVAADGSQHEVRVKVGLANESRVEVTPLDGELAAGDQVLIP